MIQSATIIAYPCMYLDFSITVEVKSVWNWLILVNFFISGNILRRRYRLEVTMSKDQGP